MHQDHALFLKSLHARSKVRLTFYSKGDSQRVTHTCAPLDFGISKGSTETSKRYHFWDFEGNQTLNLLSSQVRHIEATTESFDPAAVVTWKPRWVLKRDWGDKS